eukprot:gene12910-8767_t
MGTGVRLLGRTTPIQWVTGAHLYPRRGVASAYTLRSHLEQRLQHLRPQEALEALSSLFPWFEDPSLATILVHTVAGNAFLLCPEACSRLLEQATRHECCCWNQNENSWSTGTSLERTLEACATSRMLLSPVEEELVLCMLSSCSVGTTSSFGASRSPWYRIRAGSLLTAFLSESAWDIASDMEAFVSTNIISPAIAELANGNGGSVDSAPSSSSSSAALVQRRRGPARRTALSYAVDCSRCWSVICHRSLRFMPSYLWDPVEQHYLSALSRYASCLSQLHKRAGDRGAMERVALGTTEALLCCAGLTYQLNDNNFRTTLKLCRLKADIVFQLQKLMGLPLTPAEGKWYERFSFASAVNIHHTVALQLAVLLRTEGSALHICEAADLRLRYKLLLRRFLRCITESLPYHSPGEVLDQYQIWPRLTDMVEISCYKTDMVPMGFCDRGRLLLWGFHLLDRAGSTSAPAEASREMHVFLVALCRSWLAWVPLLSAAAMRAMWRGVRPLLARGASRPLQNPGAAVLEKLATMWRRTWARRNFRVLHHLEIMGVLHSLYDYTLLHGRQMTRRADPRRSLFLFTPCAVERELLGLCMEQLLESVRRPDTTTRSVLAQRLPPTLSPRRAQDAAARAVSRLDSGLFVDLGFFIVFFSALLEEAGAEQQHKSMALVSSLTHLFEVWRFTTPSSVKEVVESRRKAVASRYSEFFRIPDTTEGDDFLLFRRLPMPLVLSFGGQPVLSGASRRTELLISSLFIWETAQRFDLSQRGAPATLPRVLPLPLAGNNSEKWMFALCLLLVQCRAPPSAALGTAALTSRRRLRSKAAAEAAAAPLPPPWIIHEPSDWKKQRRVTCLYFQQLQALTESLHHRSPDAAAPMGRGMLCNARLFELLAPHFSPLFDINTLDWLHQWWQSLQPSGALFQNKATSSAAEVPSPLCFHVVHVLMHFPAETLAAIPLWFVSDAWQRAAEHALRQGRGRDPFPSTLTAAGLAAAHCCLTAGEHLAAVSEWCEAALRHRSGAHLSPFACLGTASAVRDGGDEVSHPAAALLAPEMAPCQRVLNAFTYFNKGPTCCGTHLLSAAQTSREKQLRRLAAAAAKFSESSRYRSRAQPSLCCIWRGTSIHLLYYLTNYLESEHTDVPRSTAEGSDAASLVVLINRHNKVPSDTRTSGLSKAARMGMTSPAGSRLRSDPADCAVLNYFDGEDDDEDVPMPVHRGYCFRSAPFYTDEGKDEVRRRPLRGQSASPADISMGASPSSRQNRSASAPSRHQQSQPRPGHRRHAPGSAAALRHKKERRPSQLSDPIRDSERQPVSFVVKSSFCTQNPFRVQSFTDFTINPDYSAPPSMKDYKAVATTSGMEGLRAVKMDSIQALKDQFQRAATASFRPMGRVSLDEVLMYLCAGEWFWKWRVEHILDIQKRQRRYFWLNGDRCALMWAMSDSVITFSQLSLRSVVEITPDCVTVNGKVMYRMTLHSEKTLIFGTEHRILFDQWYAVLQYIVSPNYKHGVAGLWKRPSVSTTTAEGKWASRYSPLQAELMEDARNKAQSTTWTD